MNQALCQSSIFFVQNFIKNNGLSQNEINEFLEIIINEDIDINFDSSTFFLFGKNSRIKISINDKTPKILLQSILDTITKNDMGDTIRNSSNKIHFRTYKHKYLLDSESDEIRKCLTKSLCAYVPKEFVQNKLVEKMIQILNIIKQPDTEDSDMCRLTVRQVRVERLIEFL